MNTRRFICALLGAWIGASFLMASVAMFNFRVVNDIFITPQPELVGYIKAIGPEKLRMLFRHEAAEFNRSLFEAWGFVQIGISLLVFGTLLFGTKEGKFILSVSLLLVLIVTGMHLLITPSIVGYGRSLDFAPADKEFAMRQRVNAYHNAYTTLEGVKLAGNVMLLVIFFREVRRRPGRGPDDEFEEIEAA